MCIVSFSFFSVLSSAIATDEMKEDKKTDTGLILGVCLGVFSWYVSAVSNIAVHFYWFLPVIAAGNVYFTCTMSYCVYYCSMDLYNSIPLSTHTSPSIQYSCISCLSSSVSIPLSLYLLLFYLLPCRSLSY